MKKEQDVIKKAEEEISIFERPSVMTSIELMDELKKAREEIKNGSDWFNAYQCIDDFLMHHLGDRFPVDSDKPERNTINAICILAGLIDSDK